MSDAVREILERVIPLSFRISHELETSKRCKRLSGKAKLLDDALRVAIRSDDILEIPALKIIPEVEQVLGKCLALVRRRRKSNLVRRIFAPIPDADIDDLESQLSRSVADVTLLVSISATADDDRNLELPENTSVQPTLAFIWWQLARLQKESLVTKANAAAALVFSADPHSKFVIKQGCAVPLLRLLEEGTIDGQEKAAMVLMALAKDEQNVDAMARSGACAVFAKVLKINGSMKVKAVVAEAMAEFADKSPLSVNIFANPQNNVTRLLVGHLHLTNRESQGHEDDAEMTSMASKALWKLAKGSPTICRSIVVSGALRRFAKLMDKGPNDVQYHLSMAFAEISRVAEDDEDMMRLVFKHGGDDSAHTIIEKLIKIVDEGDCSNKLLVPSIVTLGCLSNALVETAARTMGTLLGFLEKEAPVDVHEAAVMVLTKFMRKKNQMQTPHLEAMIGERGIRPLVKLALFGPSKEIQQKALVLMCVLALHLPHSEEMAAMLMALPFAAKRGYTARDAAGTDLIPLALAKLEAYLPRDLLLEGGEAAMFRLIVDGILGASHVLYR